MNARGYVTLKGGPVRTTSCDRSKSCIELYSPVHCDSTGSYVVNKTKSERSLRTDGFYLYADNLGHSEIRVELVRVAQSAIVKTSNELDQEDEYGSGGFGDAGNQSVVSSILDSSRYARPKPIQWSITSARIFVPEEQPTLQNLSFCVNQIGGETKCTPMGRWEDHIKVTILLRPQKFYLAADWSAVVIAFLIAVSVGCCNDPVLMRAYLRRPKPVVLGLVCKLIIVPLVSSFNSAISPKIRT